MMVPLLGLAGLRAWKVVRTTERNYGYGLVSFGDSHYFQLSPRVMCKPYSQFSSVVHFCLNNDKFDAHMPILERAFRPGILWFGAGSEIQVGRDPG